MKANRFSRNPFIVTPNAAWRQMTTTQGCDNGVDDTRYTRSALKQNLPIRADNIPRRSRNKDRKRAAFCAHSRRRDAI